MGELGFDIGAGHRSALGLGHELLELQPCRYGYSQTTFRGPAVEPGAPYLAFLGATETVGPLLTRPFPTLVSEACGLQCANLGVKNAGLDVFLSDPEIIQVANAAQAVVIEIIGAVNLSNSYYKVHPRRNDRFTRALAPLFDHEPLIDLTDVHFTGHLLAEISARAPVLHSRLREELKATWVARMHALIDALEVPVHLICTVNRSGQPARAPFVDSIMVTSVARVAHSLTCIRPSTEARANGTREMFFSPPEAAVAARMLSAAAHRETAAQLARPVIAQLRRGEDAEESGDEGCDDGMKKARAG